MTPHRTKPVQPTKPAARETLRRVRDLERRLAESELRREEVVQTLEAIRTGAVDAVLVSSPQGERVFTLQGAEQSYRLLVETVNAGALTVALDGTIMYANAQTAAFLHLPLEQVIGEPIERFILPEDRVPFRALFRAGQAGAAAGEVRLAAVDRPPVAVHLALRQLASAEPHVVCIVATDLTERKQAESALQQANARLETRVAERTAALAKSNGQLQEANIQLEELNAELTQEAEQRRQTEAALAASEERYRGIVETAEEGIATHAPDGTITYVNRRLADMLGYPREDILGRSSLDFVDADEQEAVLRAREGLKTHGSFSAERKLRRKDGSILWTLANVTPQRDDAGHFLGYLALHTDITERKRVEAALRESEAHYQGVVQHTTAIILRVDRQGVIRFANDRALDFFGYTAEELIGQPALGTIVPERQSDGRDLRTMVADIVKAPNRFHTNANENLRKNGERVWVEWTNSGIYDAEGRLTQFLAVGIDATERRRAEDDLRRSEARYRLLHETLRDAFVQVTMDGRIVECNDAYCEMLGYSREELSALTYQDLTPERWRAFEDRLVREQILARGYSDVYEKEYRRKDGTIVPVELRTILARDAAGQPSAMWGIVRDITERKRAEETLRASEERFRVAQEVSPDGFTILRPVRDDAGSVVDFTWVYENAAVARLNGTDAAAVVGRRLLEEFPGHRGSVFFDTYRAVAEAGQPRVVEAAYQGESMTRQTWFRLAVVPMGPDIAIHAQDITERKRTEEELARATRWMNEILASIQDDFYVLDRDWKFVYTSRHFTARIGRKPQDFMGRNIWAMFPKHVGTVLEENFRAAMDRREVRRFEIPGQYTDAWYGMTVFPSAEGITVLGVDLTERKRAEDRLRRALADNEALLREVHHRVKNNLQMLCDLMFLQMEAMPDRDQHQDLQDAYSRIYAIARLHEMLYQAMHGGAIVLADYLGRLAGGFSNLFPALAVRVEAEPGGVALDLDRAIHVGLIVNELITNAMKHAFPKGRPGEVVVALRRLGEQVELQVRDNGRGLPAVLNLAQAKSVGLRTVYILAKRLEASVEVGNHGGTTFTLTFPLKGEEPVDPKGE